MGGADGIYIDTEGAQHCVPIHPDAALVLSYNIHFSEEMLVVFFF